MFTGLVEELGKVRSLSRGTHSIRLTIAAEKVLRDVKMGDSIAVDGACLTVVDFSAGSFTVDVMPETFDRTTLSMRKSGDTVNLERTLRVGDRLGGHIVSGHVDAVADLVSVTPRDNANILRVQVPRKLAPFLIPQGSVAVDGVSLTIVDCGDDWFEVSLIPHTAAETTLGCKGIGANVNLEGDIIGKYVERLLSSGRASPVTKPRTSDCASKAQSTLTTEFLASNGFF